jgi:hypothetical protein
MIFSCEADDFCFGVIRFPRRAYNGKAARKADGPLPGHGTTD